MAGPEPCRGEPEGANIEEPAGLRNSFDSGVGPNHHQWLEGAWEAEPDAMGHGYLATLFATSGN